MIIQIPANCNVRTSIATIIPVQMITPNAETNLYAGALNGRTMFGSFLRSIQTPALTRTNANNVPKLVRSPATCPGTNAANKPTNTKSIQFALYGVLYLG